MYKRLEPLTIGEPIIAPNVPVFAPEPVTPLAIAHIDKPTTQTFVVPTKTGEVKVVTPIIPIKTQPINYVNVNEAGNPVNNQVLHEVVVKSGAKKKDAYAKWVGIALDVAIAGTGLFLVIFLGKKLYNYFKKSSKKSRR